MSQSFNFIDYFILGIMAISIILGFISGFIRSILSVLVWIAAFFASAIYGPHLATTFSLVTSNPEAQLWLSYGTVFIVAIIIGFVIKLILNLILTGGETGILNRFCGALFGCARGVLIVVLFAWFALLVGMNQSPAFKASKLMPFFDGVLVAVENAFPSINEAAQSAISSLNTSGVVQNTQNAVSQAATAVQQNTPAIPSVSVQH